MTKSSQKGSNCIPFFESTYPECKENIYLEYMNISRQPSATW